MISFPLAAPANLSLMPITVLVSDFSFENRSGDIKSSIIENTINTTNPNMGSSTLTIEYRNGQINFEDFDT